MERYELDVMHPATERYLSMMGYSYTHHFYMRHSAVDYLAWRDEDNPDSYIAIECKTDTRWIYVDQAIKYRKLLDAPCYVAIPIFLFTAALRNDYAQHGIRLIGIDVPLTKYQYDRRTKAVAGRQMLTSYRYYGISNNQYVRLRT